ncbi:MAG: hypothetical protein NTV51_03910 [Verrucomicrobia bacterium]|nr:hypothetical protein [Verrucomicrobiota bacterium]
MTADNSQRLAEIKARAEAAEAVPDWGDTRKVAALVACGEDVPFLLEQLERAVAHGTDEESQNWTALTKLAASEAAASQMRAALERAVRPTVDFKSAFDAIHTALSASDAGKGWLSPEQAARQVQQLQSALDSLREHMLMVQEAQKEVERTKNEMATLRECKAIVERQRNEHRVAKGGGR